MAKTFSEKQIREQAIDVFKANPKSEMLFGTSDGQFFYKKPHADLHAREAGKTGAPLRVYEINRQEKAEDEPIDDELSWQERVKRMEAAESITDVEKYLEGETAKSVKEAAEKRIQELKSAE